MRIPKRWRGVLCIAVLVAGTSPSFAQIFTNGDTGEAERDRARNAAVSAARGQVDRAQQLLTVAEQRVQANWKANPQYQASLKEQQDAKTAYGAERDRVLEQLRSDPTFRQAKQAESDAAMDVHQAQANATQPAAAPGTAKPPGPSPEQMQAAEQKLQDKSRLRKMENDAIAADPEAAKAKARLDKADDELKLLSLQLKAALLNDPDYKSALDQLTQAKAQLATAAGSN